MSNVLYCRECGDPLTTEGGRLCDRCRWEANQERFREDEDRYDEDDAREEDDYR